MKVRKNCDRFKCDFKWKNVKKENGNVKKKKPKTKKVFAERLVLMK